jgi:hypothetical protein
MTIPREITAPFVADPGTGVCIRTRLKGLTDTDEAVLRQLGTHLGRLAGADLAARVRTGLGHDKDGWADRKRGLTVESTARWAGAITKATHDQWGVARHHAASVAIGRRALGHRIRRRVAPPPPHRSDGVGHRTTQAQSGVRERETTRHPRPGPRTRCVHPPGAKNAERQAAQYRSGQPTEQTQFRSVSRNGGGAT